MPGAERSTQYPSTVAYIATLLLHRYKVLGIRSSLRMSIDSAFAIAPSPRGCSAPLTQTSNGTGAGICIALTNAARKIVFVAAMRRYSRYA